MNKEEIKIPQWEAEKKANLIEAFTRVMQGEPADGGLSKDETREYLIEFREALLAEIEEKVPKKEYIPVEGGTRYQRLCDDWNSIREHILKVIGEMK